jgi:TolB-like protein/DNA-binding SARP family transcriptional activator/cytochrome c-type biogenesis protein CcmH/NrfG
MIEFRMLGGTALRRDGRDLDSVLSGCKRLGLLTYLVLARPRGFQRRDTLLALLWPERGQASARNALSNMLYHLRRELGGDVIVNRGTEEIGIRRELISCDVIAFEAALERGATEQALDRYRGMLLPGFHVPDAAPDFSHWLDAERERLRLRAAEAAWDRADTAEQQGDESEARMWARKAAGFTPLSDDAQKRLIALLARVGDRSGARVAYEAFAERLRDEWDMEPTDELTTLLDDIETKPGGTPEASAAPPFAYQTGQTEAEESDVLPRLNPQPPRDTRSPTPPSPASTTDEPESPTDVAWAPGWWGGVIGGLLLLVAGWLLWSGTPFSTGGVPIASNRSVAVLPFTYLSAEDSTDYFSLGMTEEILMRLAQVQDLSVISRTSVMQYRDTEKSLRTIGAELGAGAIVEGSVQRVGEEVRITAQLIDARTDRHLWGASYSGALQDILTVQSEVAVRVAEALEAELLPNERAQLAPHPNVNAEAYHLYLRAQHLRNQRDPAQIVQAPALFRRAIAQDSTFAPAYSGLAMSLIGATLINRFDVAVTGVTGPSRDATVEAGMRAAKRALALDSTLVEAHLAQGLVHELFANDWKRSGRAFQQALRLNPNHSETRREYGYYLLRLGQVGRALDQMHRAVQLDPLSSAAYHSLGYAYYCDRQYERAIQTLETALSLAGRYPNTKKYLSTARFKRSQELFRQGRDAEAEALLDVASMMLVEMWGEENDWHGLLEHAVRGERAKALARIDQGEIPFAPRLYSFLLLGEQTSALDLLENGPSFHWRVYVDPMFDPVRDDPRFAQIVLRRHGQVPNPGVFPSS